MESNLSTDKADLAVLEQERDDAAKRRSGSDRRDDGDRRRRAAGLFEKRARREFGDSDRRQGDRRDDAWSWLAFWRRGKVDTETLT